MIYDDFTHEELQEKLKENLAQQSARENDINLLETAEEDCMRMLHEDRIATESLHSGWTGEDAEKYISKALEENEHLQKQCVQAFSQEKDRLQSELKKLQTEAQDISDALDRKKTEE